MAEIRDWQKKNKKNIENDDEETKTIASKTLSNNTEENERRYTI